MHNRVTIMELAVVQDGSAGLTLHSGVARISLRYHSSLLDGPGHLRSPLQGSWHRAAPPTFWTSHCFFCSALVGVPHSFASHQQWTWLVHPVIAATHASSKETLIYFILFCTILDFVSNSSQELINNTVTSINSRGLNIIPSETTQWHSSDYI